MTFDILWMFLSNLGNILNFRSSLVKPGQSLLKETRMVSRNIRKPSNGCYSSSEYFGLGVCKTQIENSE